MLTKTNPDGTWSCTGIEFKGLSGNMYGALCRLRDYEKTGLNPDDFRANSYEKMYVYKIHYTKSVVDKDGKSHTEVKTLYCPDKKEAEAICAALKSNGYMDAAVNRWSWQMLIEE